MLSSGGVLVDSMLAGCGSQAQQTGSTTSGNSVAEAKQLVKQAESQNATFEPPGPGFDASKARGKTAWWITILGIPFVTPILQGIKEGFDSVGAKVVAFDGKAQVAEYSRGIQQAIGQNADLIFVASLEGSLFKADFDKAKSLGIPVVMYENHDPGGVGSDEPPGVVAETNQCHQCAGKIMADFAIADSGGKGHMVVFWSADIPGIGQPQVDGITNEFKRLCPGCQVTVKDVPIAQWQTLLPTLTQSTLTSDPSVNYLLPLYDGMVLYMLPAVHAANAQKRVKIVSFNVTPAVMQAMAKSDVVAADCGTDPIRLGWACADQLLRVMSGVQPVPDIKLPIKLFTRDNVGGLDLSNISPAWFGPVDYRSEYKKLWGVK